MKLHELRLKNFRGYKNACVKFDKNLNVIIGKNDIGKSTIMEALNIFFNSDSSAKIKIERNDLNIYASESQEIEICCLFSECNEDIILDTSIETKLKDEFLLNKDELLEIRKVWNCSKEKINTSDLKIYINAWYPDIASKPLINMKRQELQKILGDIRGSIHDCDGVNKNVNSEIRKCLYDYYRSDGVEFRETEIDIKQIDSKEIWPNINKHLPIFSLFKSDRANIDSDSEIQNPLKIATKNILKDIEHELDEIKKKVEEAVSLISDKTIEKLREMDADIAGNLNTNLDTKAWDSIFSFEIIDDRGIPLNKRGSGVRRLMVLSYFRAEADRLLTQINKTNIIYAIEEPETAQHPDYQKMIIETFQELSLNNNHQIILTTHTPQIAKMVRPDQIIFITRDEEKQPLILEDTAIKIPQIVNSLGILPSIENKLIICVEGPTDIKFLENISKLECFKEILDLDKCNISIIPMIGGNLQSWIDKNYFNGTDVKEFHLYDGDIPKYSKKIQEMNSQNDGRRFGVTTSRREIENYIPPILIEEEFGISISQTDKEQWHEIDISTLLLESHNLKKRLKQNDLKGYLNGRICKSINKDLLIEMGTYKEIEGWFIKIKELYN